MYIKKEREKKNMNPTEYTLPETVASAPVVPSHSGKPSRVEWLDILRGFMMYFVIYGHITEWDDAIDYIYSFHMPVFFLISGITSRFSRETSTLRFIWKKFFGLVVPYFILNLYVVPLRKWLELIGECNLQSVSDQILGILFSNSNTGYKMASNTLWFLPCLFLTSVLFFLLRRTAARIAGKFLAKENIAFSLSGMTDFLTAFLVILTIAVATILDLNQGSGGIWHYRGAIYCTGFFLAGYLLVPLLQSFQGHIQASEPFLMSQVMILFYIGYILSDQNGYVSIIRNRYGNLFLYYGSAICTGLAFVFLFMMLSESSRFLKLAKPLDYIGRKTLPYIAFQVPVMKLLSYYIPAFGSHVEPVVTILSLLLFVGLILPAGFIDRHLPRKATYPAVLEGVRH